MVCIINRYTYGQNNFIFHNCTSFYKQRWSWTWTLWNKCLWSRLYNKKVAILLQARTVYSGMTFTVSARRSEHYPIRQWHMVRNKAFVLRDQKIRIVFPLNQWAVCFTAMNNALPLQTCFPRSLSPSPSRSPFAMLAAVQCLKCFHTCALHNKVKILIPLRECFIFT